MKLHKSPVFSFVINPLVTKRSSQLSLLISTNFEAQAQRTPDSLSAVFADACLSYSELEGRSRRVAGRLHQLGIGPEVAVGLALERSLGLTVGLMGILRSGGFYVPLDPSFGRTRERSRVVRPFLF